jgi:hypothetical protein
MGISMGDGQISSPRAEPWSVVGSASGSLPQVLMMQNADQRYLDHLGPGCLPLEHTQLMP